MILRKSAGGRMPVSLKKTSSFLSHAKPQVQPDPGQKNLRLPHLTRLMHMHQIWAFLLCLLIALSPLLAQAKKTAPDNQYYCYWMENISGRFEWVPAEVGGIYRGEGYQRCFELDSCNGGRGDSGGGCYKWARTSVTLPVKWAQKAEK